MNRQADGEETGRRWPGCGRRLLRGCGLSLLAVLLVVLVTYGCEFYRCTRYAPTGDALFDRYARAVIRGQAWKLFHSGSTHPATLPDKLLASWEDDFGTDPRYWQLRYWCALHRYYNYHVFTDGHPWYDNQRPSQREAEKYLQQAVNRGVANADTIWFLFQEERVNIRHSWDELETQLDELGASEQRRLQQEHGKWAEDRELELLDEMVDAGPDQAWPYYWRAKYWFELGETEQAQADLKAGNQAADNHIPRLFPISAMYKSLDQESAYGNQCVSGAVLEIYGYSAVINWNEWLEVGREVQLALALGGDLGLAADFHRFACRLGQADNAASVDLIYSEYLIEMLPEYLLTELSEGMTTDQKLALWKAYNRASYIDRMIRRTTDHVIMQQPGLPLPMGLYPPISYWGMGGGEYSPATLREINWNTLDRYIVPPHLYRYLVWIHQTMQKLTSEMRPEFAELEQVDYENLDAALEDLLQ